MTRRRSLLAALLVLGLPTIALAQTQEGEVVEGARDFRTAPILSDGAYTDTILVGETLWYGVYLLNDDEKEFDVFSEILLDGRDNLALEVEWIGPTLGLVDSGDEIEASAFYYGSSNDGDTWLWFLKFTVDSESGALEEIPFRFTVAGAETYDSSACSLADDCELAVQASELESEIAQLEELIASGAGGPATGPQPEVVQLEEEISRLENELTSYQNQADGLQAEIAALEQTTAESASPTSTEGWSWGVLLYIAGLLAAAIGLYVYFTGERPDEETSA